MLVKMKASNRRSGVDEEDDQFGDDGWYLVVEARKIWASPQWAPFCVAGAGEKARVT